MPQHKWSKDKTRPPRRGTEIQKEVHSRHVTKSKSKDRLTMIPAPSASLISGGTESGGGGAILVPASSQLQVSELALADSTRQLADDSIDSQDGEYVNDHSQSEQNNNEEGEDENDEDLDDEDDEDKLEQHEENGNLSSGWRAQKPIGYGFPESQPLILTITTGHTQGSREDTYPSRGAPVLICISQNCFTPRMLSRWPIVLNRLETPAITPSHSDPTAPQMHSAGGQQTSSRRNMAVGLKRSIVLKARNLIWDWTMFVNLFPDVITLNEAFGRCWKDAQRELGFPNFADATPASSDLVCCP